MVIATVIAVPLGNQMSAAMGLGPTGRSLVDATYRSLGYRRARYDTWVR